jgi:ribulose-5-phosphate 4-epimerase/fuculose-1-phosphate aldolase
MTNIGKSREQICRLGESLFNRGFTVGSSGNISVRLSDDRWLVTPTNACLGRLDPERLSVIDSSGNLIDGDPPTKESFLHLAIYDQRPSDGAVVHLHSTHSVAVSLLPDVNPNQPVPPLTAYYVMKVRDLILLPYYAPGDLSLANAVRAVAGKHHAVLLANHGPIVSGKTVEEAVYASEELEETSKLFLLLKDHKPRMLTEDQVLELKEKWHS